MITYTQDSAPLRLHSLLGKDALIPISVRGDEGINRLFAYTIEAVAPDGKSVAIDKLLGTDALLEIRLPTGPARYIHGDIHAVSHTVSRGPLRRFNVDIRPSLARLARVRRSRVFHNLDLLEIFRQVTKGVCSITFELHRPIASAVNLVTQYRETDLEFFMRLCGETGLAWFWRHTEKGHELVLTSRTSLASTGGTIAFDPTEGITESRPRIWSWSVTGKQVARHAEILDTHFQWFGLPLQAEGRTDGTIKAGSTEYRLGTFTAPSQEDALGQARLIDSVGINRENVPQGMDQVQDRLESAAKWAAQGMASEAVTAIAEGNCPHLQPGQSVNIASLPEWEGDWIVTGMAHDIRISDGNLTSNQTTLECRVGLRLAPIALEQFPWPPLPKPNVGGVLTAVVTGPEGLETFVDPFGRVKVQYLWDREARGLGDDSFWIRVSQNWAGKGYGTFFWPRIGNEVVVAFENGDPDRPIVVGSVYNSHTGTPLALPGMALVQGLRTRLQGSQAGEKAHSLLFSDDPSEPIVHLKSNTMFLVHQRREQQNSSTDTQFNIRG